MNIQTEYIKSILPKYYAGESTTDEDRILREYFLEEDVDPELATDKATFMALFSDTTAPESLRLKIEKEIDRRTVKAVQRRLRPRYGRIAAAAAILAVAVSASVHFFGTDTSAQQISPEEAKEHTIKALTLLTSTVKKGCAAMETSAQTTASTLQTVEQTLKTHKNR